jgi:hypothetical protein
MLARPRRSPNRRGQRTVLPGRPVPGRSTVRGAGAAIPESRPVAVRESGGRRDRSRESGYAVKLHLGASEVPSRSSHRHRDGRRQVGALLREQGQSVLDTPVPAVPLRSRDRAG